MSCGNAEPMKGAAELLNAIKKAGLKIVLVTGSGQKSLLDKLNHSFPNIFAPGNMVTAFDVKSFIAFCFFLKNTRSFFPWILKGMGI